MYSKVSTVCDLFVKNNEYLFGHTISKVEFSQENKV